METASDLDRDPELLKHARNLRRVGVAALVVLIGLGISGALDPSDDEVADAEGHPVALEVDYPSRVRSGLDASLDITVARPTGFQRPVTISIRREWLDLFRVGSVEPQPDRATGSEARLIWTFEPPPTKRLQVSVDLTLRPAVRAGKEGRVAYLENGLEQADVTFDTVVVP